jgi:NTP pyrophosphatase (non-canonical NTP hydrolase)
MDDLIKKIREFRQERDWDQYHSPKNLAMALVVEASELVENFQWLTEEQSAN